MSVENYLKYSDKLRFDNNLQLFVDLKIAFK